MLLQDIQESPQNRSRRFALKRFKAVHYKYQARRDVDEKRADELLGAGGAFPGAVQAGEHGLVNCFCYIDDGGQLVDDLVDDRIEHAYDASLLDVELLAWVVVRGLIKEAHGGYACVGEDDPDAERGWGEVGGEDGTFDPDGGRGVGL